MENGKKRGTKVHPLERFYRIERIFKVAELFLPTFIQLNKERLQERRGVALSVITILKDDESNIVGEDIIIGDLPTEKKAEKLNFAREKISRIRKNKEYSSFESADDAKKQYGGGIKANDTLYIAASGFPPDLDQEFIMLVSLIAGEMKMDNYNRIKILSYKSIKN